MDKYGATLGTTIEMVLRIGADSGLHTVQEALDNVMHHYDAFFLIDNLPNEMRRLHDSMIEAGLAEGAHDGIVVKDMTIDEALTKLGSAPVIQMDKRHCTGCNNDFYNGSNPYDIKECWSLTDARLIMRKEVPIHQAPPWNQEARLIPDCYKRTGFIYVRWDYPGTGGM